MAFIDKFPSSAAFDDIAAALSDESERKDAIKKGGAIFAFSIKNEENETKEWYVDLKETGKVGQGSAPEGKKANVTMSMHVNEFAKLMTGSANAQKLFMTGKLKIKGDVMKATRMEPILKRAQQKQKETAKL